MALFELFKEFLNALSWNKWDIVIFAVNNTLVIKMCLDIVILLLVSKLVWHCFIHLIWYQVSDNYANFIDVVTATINFFMNSNFIAYFLAL